MMKKISFFTDVKLLKEVPKGYIFPIIDYWNQNTHDFAEHYEITDDIEKCSIAILPVSIDFLLNNKKEKLANDFIKKAANYGKKVLVFTSGDFGVSLKNKNIITVRLAGFKSKFLHPTFIMPPFINDPYVFLNKEISYLKKERVPKIGFVGHSATGMVKLSKEFFVFGLRYLRRVTGKDRTDHQSFYPSSLFRFKYLKIIKNSKEVSCDFILRNQYRAGVKTEAEKVKTSHEFFQNIYDNPYTFCMRGGGNFSVRFYETLAMGRIPILIDTDCQLPFFDRINWQNHCLIVKENEVKDLPMKLLEFHSRFSPEEFLALQHENRLLWEQNLTRETFFKQLAQPLKILQ